MTIAYFDCFSGISGDMTLGALLDCGIPLEALRDGLSSLPVQGWDISASPVLQSGIHALDVTVSLHGQTDADELAHHHHEHHHHEHHHAHGRSMAEIRQLIEDSGLSEKVKRTSLDIFGRIAVAEAHLHHSTPEEVHFHEIGGVDSLIDICGVAWCLEYLGVEEVHCSPLPHSSGWVRCAHGLMPVPAPATLELLKNVPMIPTGIEGELVTPTGAGIVASLSRSFGPMPAMRPRAIGSGSGKKRFPDRPNILRVVIGEKAEDARVAGSSSLAGLEWRTLTILESNIDDMNPEIYSYVMERLFEAGALDVWLQSVQMKKNRPGVLLCALCAEERRDALIQILLRETTTLGVRLQSVQRAALPRTQTSVQTPFGPIAVKAVDWPQGNVRRALPEWDDVMRVAREQGVAAREVYEATASSAQQGRIDFEVHNENENV